MSVDSRRIERLILGVPQVSDTRQATHTVHEALRLASMPGDGHPGRLFIRRLELPAFRLDRGAHPLAIALAKRVRDARGSAIAIGDRRATTADEVIARDDVEPLATALMRAAKGQRLTEWFWPQVDARLQAKLGPIAVAALAWRLLAERRDAAIAIPAVMGALLDAEPMPDVFAAIDPGLGAVLLAKLGVAPIDVSAWPVVLRTIALPSWQTVVRAVITGWGPDLRARWLMTAIVRAAQPWNARCVLPSEQVIEPHPLAEDESAHAAISPKRVDAQTHALSLRSPVAEELDEPLEVSHHARLRDAHPDNPHIDHQAASSASTTHLPSGEREPPPAQPPAAKPSHPDAAPLPSRWSLLERPTPTRYGGLLFLIHPLERLGLGTFIDQHLALQRCGFGLHLFDHLARHLQIPPEEPIRVAIRPPECPEDLVLPSPPDFDDLPQRDRSESNDLTGLTQSWITALETYVERVAKLDLATVAHRPAALTCTRTHVDVIFDMQASDIQIRRVGFDIDPGYVRWLGRVVSFHYVFGGLLS